MNSPKSACSSGPNFYAMRLNVYFYTIILCLAGFTLKAQVFDTQVIGVYNLTGVMETAVGINLRANHTFEYGFIYGAADKWGQGSWKVSGNQVVLNSSHAQPEQDFKIQSSVKSKQPGIQIKFTSAQGQPLQYIKCKLGNETAEADAQGVVSFEKINNGKLELYHPIFGTRLTQLSLNPSHNSFIIQPTADLTEVFFQNYTLDVQGNNLIGSELPGMPTTDAAGNAKRYVFKKE